MASCVILDSSIDRAVGGQDTVVFSYLADLGEVVVNPVSALQKAQTLGPSPVPILRDKLAGAFLFVTNISGRRAKESREAWQFDVTFSLPEDNETEQSQRETNPLLRPPIFGIDYIEEEYVVEQARNVEALGVAQFAGGGPYRASGTLAPITNGAGVRPDEPIVRTRRKALLKVQRNYADLGQIFDLNETYQDTTNSDTVTLGSHDITARRLKYECTRELGVQTENGITYYPAITEISVEKTTDLVLDNVGYSYYTTAGALKRFLDEDGEPLADPQNLTLTGLESTSKTTITYRDLEPVEYAGFFE